jgi:hypothetical protein
MTNCKHDEEIECLLNLREASQTWEVCIPCRLASIVRQLKCLNFASEKGSKK